MPQVLYTTEQEVTSSAVCVSQLMAQSDHMWPVKQCDHKKSSQVNNQLQIHTSRPNRDTKPPVKFDLFISTVCLPSVYGYKYSVLY